MISLLDPHQVGRHTVVGVTGEIDVASAPVLRDTLLAQLNRGVESLVVDLRGVTFIDSTGVGSLLRVHHRQGLLGGAVHFVADQPSVLRKSRPDPGRPGVAPPIGRGGPVRRWRGPGRAAPGRATPTEGGR